MEKLDAAAFEVTQPVRPATEAHVDEAVEALRAGKLIAVPTDTLYGFACDAWYVIPPMHSICLMKCLNEFLCDLMVECEMQLLGSCESDLRD